MCYMSVIDVFFDHYVSISLILWRELFNHNPCQCTIIIILKIQRIKQKMLFLT